MSAGTSKTVTVTYSDSETSATAGNTYLPWNWSFDIENTTEYEDGFNIEHGVFWYKGKNVKLFDSESRYYGYQVTITRKSLTTCTFEGADANFWCVGTAGQLMNGENRGGIVKSTSFTVWVPTDNSIQSIHMAPFFHFVDDYYSFEDEITYSQYNINASYTVKYVGYETVAEYSEAMNSIQTELEDQTVELEEQTQELGDINTELDTQTEELEEQTETQKGIMKSLSDFFGSFFDNLIDSIIGLFVPSTEEMKSLFDRLMDFFNERFGFLFYPFDFFIRVVDLFLDSEGGSTAITFPGFSMMGYQIWDDMTFDLTEYDIVVDLFGYVRLITGAFISIGFINYLRNNYEKLIRR